MQNIQVKRYQNEKTRRYWLGTVEPEDGSWVVFIDSDEVPHLYRRTSAVTSDGKTDEVYVDVEAASD